MTEYHMGATETSRYMASMPGYVLNRQGHWLPTDIEAQMGWGVRDLRGTMTRGQMKTLAALLMAQGLSPTSPGPNLKRLYDMKLQMKGDSAMPHTVPSFGHHPQLWPRPPEGSGHWIWMPDAGQSPVGADDSEMVQVPTHSVQVAHVPRGQHLRMMHQRHLPRRGGFRPIHRRIHVDIDFDADVVISGMQGTAPMITLTGDFDPMDPVMGSFLSNIAHAVTKGVSSVAKTVAKAPSSVAKTVAKVPGVKIALAPIKAITHPAATVKSVASAVTHPLTSLKSVPGTIVKTAVQEVKSTAQAAKAVVQAANTIRKSPLVTAGVTGLALAVPAIGIPAKATLDQANKAIDQAKSNPLVSAGLALTQKLVQNSKSLNPVVAASAKTIIVNTANQAKTGDPTAKQAMQLMAIHAVNATTSPKVQDFHFRVTEQGRIQRIA